MTMSGWGSVCAEDFGAAHTVIQWQTMFILIIVHNESYPMEMMVMIDAVLNKLFPI